MDPLLLYCIPNSLHLPLHFRSPPESTVIHDPLSRPPSTRSSRSQSHLTTASSPPHPLPPPPLTTAITTDRPRALSASSAASSSVTAPVPPSQRHNTYHHLRQHEGMQPLPQDYPIHEYSSLGPRSTTPPLRPPKPSHLRNTHEEVVRRVAPNSEFSSRDPPVSATGPSWGTAVETDHHRHTHQNSISSSHRQDSTNTHTSTQQVKYDVEGDECTSTTDDVFTHRSIYNTMTEDATLTNGHLLVAGSSDEQLNSTSDNFSHKQHIGEQPPPSKPGRRDYDKLIMPSSAAGHQHHNSQKSNFRITNNSPPSHPSSSSVSSHGDADSINKTRSSSVKVTDPRYTGQYERHPDYISPQVEIPRDQLQAKYRGDYERDSTYFTRNPTRSFSVSAASTQNVIHSEKQQERSFSLSAHPSSLADKYRGDYERSGDYFLPPAPPLTENEIKTDDYVLEPDPNYTGAYERHPNYVPPLVKRSSKTKIHILSGPTSSNTAKTNTSVAGGTSGGHNCVPSSVPHEYTALAAVTKDPPQQYTTLSNTPSSTLQKDTTV